MRPTLPTTPRGRALLAGAVVVIVGLLYLLVSLYIVNTALVAERNEIEERPEDFGLVYEEVEFSPRDWPELTLRGWWMPVEDAKGTVIRVHGLDGTRDSSLGLSKALVDGGYSVLVFDLRGHGESDIAQMGAGIHEQDDLRGAIDYVLNERGAEPGRVLVYGDSFGGAIALMTVIDEPAVVGLFSDSSFTSVSDLMIQEIADRTRAARWSATLLRPGHPVRCAYGEGAGYRHGASRRFSRALRLSARVGALPRRRTCAARTPGADTRTGPGGAPYDRLREL